MDPCPHLWFLYAKQGLLGQNYKSLWVPAFICGFFMQNSVICTRITSLYGFQLSSVVLCMQNIDFRTSNTSLYGFMTSSVVLSTHSSVLSTRISRPYGFQPSPVVLCMQNRDFRTRIKSLCGSKPHLCFLHLKQRLLDQNNKSLWV